MPRDRPMTDMYLAAVGRAVAQPGTWVNVPRTFKTKSNALKTGSCLEGGYLRVEPRERQGSVLAEGKWWLATAAPVERRVTRSGDLWVLDIRFVATRPYPRLTRWM